MGSTKKAKAMKQLKIICCLLSLLVSIIEAAVACDTKANCKDVEEKTKTFFDKSIEDQREILIRVFIEMLSCLLPKTL